MNPRRYGRGTDTGIALVNDVVRETREQGGSAMIVLHDRHSAGDMLDRLVCFKQGMIDSNVSLRPAETHALSNGTPLSPSVLEGAS